MFNFTPEDHQKIIKLFEFLDSETPAAKAWIRNYLVRKGLNSPQETWAAQSSQLYAVDQITSCLSNFSEIKLLANQMSNAWRGRKHRQNKNLVNLSVGLDKAVSIKLTEMSKGRTRTEVITQLIEGNYQVFLNIKNQQKLKETESKRILQMKRDKDRLQVQLTKTLKHSSEVDNRLDLNDDLREAIANLYNIIFLANEDKRIIDDQTLLQATRVYYAAFAK